MWYKKNTAQSKGFSFMEMLCVIVILTIIFAVLLIGIKVILKDSNDKISDITKKAILSAANEYAVEYRNLPSWKENINENDEVLFCISFDTLLDKGYFKNSGSNFNDISKDYYAIRGKIVNGVYNYEFIELADVADGDICKYYIRKTNLINDLNIGVNNVKNKFDIIGEDTNEILGELKYEINQFDNNYEINYDLNINLYDVIATNAIYINVLLDKSGSMRGTKFTSAKNAIINFSNLLRENENLDARMSLIEFANQPNLRRNFESMAFTDKDFSTSAGGSTNAPGAVDLATSLIYNSAIDDKDIYTILLFDGAPNLSSYIIYSSSITGALNDQISPSSAYNLNKNYDLLGDAQIYYKNFSNAVLGCGTSKSCDKFFLLPSGALKEGEESFQASLSSSSGWKSLITSSEYLKSIGSKLIVIGYGRDFGTNAQNIATTDPELCSNSKDGKNCYYFKSSGSEISEMFNLLAKEIIRRSSVNNVKLIFESQKTDGEPLVNFYDKEGNITDRIEVEISLENLEADAGNLNIADGYTFQFSDHLFSQISCDDDICTYIMNNENNSLFNIKLQLEYLDERSTNIAIELPKFEIEIYKESTLN